MTKKSMQRPQLISITQDIQCALASGSHLTDLRGRSHKVHLPFESTRLNWNETSVGNISQTTAIWINISVFPPTEIITFAAKKTFQTQIKSISPSMLRPISNLALNLQLKRLHCLGISDFKSYCNYLASSLISFKTWHTSCSQNPSEKKTRFDVRHSLICRSYDSMETYMNSDLYFLVICNITMIPKGYTCGFTAIYRLIIFSGLPNSPCTSSLLCTCTNKIDTNKY